MKIPTIILLFLAISSVFTQKKEKSIPAQTTSDGKSQSAVHYAYGSNGGYTLKNENNYKTPEIVQGLVKKSPYEGTENLKAVADEVPSITNYYDGATKLNTVKVTCKMYVNTSSCVHQNHCGWCGQTNSCINGNQMGPLEVCAASTYIFTTGAIPNPNERLITENVGPYSMTILNK